LPFVFALQSEGTKTQDKGDDNGRKEGPIIVKETINALHGSSGAADDRTKKHRDQIVRALTEAKGRVGGVDGAAARLRINRTTLLARMKKLGIDPRDYA